MREVRKPYKERKRKHFFSDSPQSRSLFSASLQTFCFTVWETTWICKNTNCFAVKWGNTWYSIQQWTVLMLVLACHLSPHRGFHWVGIPIKIAPQAFFFPSHKPLYNTKRTLWRRETCHWNCGTKHHARQLWLFTYYYFQKTTFTLFMLPIKHLVHPPKKTLHKHCFQFLLGITILSWKETEDNACPIFWGGGGNKVLYGQ